MEADRSSQKGHRLPVELIRKMTPSLAHSTPLREAQIHFFGHKRLLER
jgi:hypothetical protein